MHSLRSFFNFDKITISAAKEIEESVPQLTARTISCSEIISRGPYQTDTIFSRRNANHPGELSHEEFMLGWVALAYIAPGLDPDDAAIRRRWDGPAGWRPVAAEAFRRFGTKELTREELYPRPVSLSLAPALDIKKGKAP